MVKELLNCVRQTYDGPSIGFNAEDNKINIIHLKVQGSGSQRY